MLRETQSEESIQSSTKIDLSNCAREPIHIPGLIQPHGLLIVLDESGNIIRQVSNNSPEMLGIHPSELIDHSLEELIGAEQCGHVRRILRGDVLLRDNPLKLKLPVVANGREFNVLMHKVDDEIIFEAEPVQDDDDANLQNFYQDLRQTTSRLQSTVSEEMLCHVVADEVRRIIAYDRVMIYRFDEDWNGQVIAESRDDQIESSYLGLHFPASDIPEQARRIFAVNRLRGIPNAGYTPVGLSAGKSRVRDRPLDMSQSVLRSVSPMHIEYLRNMGVGATLTVSLLKNGKLWGLIACHHSQPKLVCIERRVTCSFLGQIIESQLNMRQDGLEKAYRMQTSAIQVRFVDLLARASSLKGLENDPTSVLDFVDARGAAIIESGECTLLGETPNEDEVMGLIEMMKSTLKERVYVSDSLSQSYPAAESFKDVASGMLGVEISGERGDYLLWFRPEQVRTVHWAGNPEKAVTIENGTTRLHPRKSFELWKQAVRLRSLRWKPEEIAAVVELSETCRNVLMGEEERTRELRQREQAMRDARDEAQSANIAMSEFLANMSHEIRTPMTAIQGYADLLYETGDLEKAPAHRLEAIRTIQRNSEHLLNIINDILDISKIKAGKMTVESVPCDVFQLISEVESLMRNRAESKKLALVVEFVGLIPESIQTDSTRLKQILVNLIGNAIKFTERGSVRVIARVRHGAIPRLEIDVADTGVGIPVEAQSRLFQPFVQAENSTTRRFGGTGLGLTISRRFAEMLGGGLTIVDSQPGQGTVFRLSIGTGTLTGIPMMKATIVTESRLRRENASIPIETKSLAGVRILLAEDGPDNQRLISVLLKRAGASVEVAENGRIACNRILSTEIGSFDVILMDMQMPELDGYGATAHLRSHDYNAPIIALTAHAMADDRLKCINAGCDDYVVKPIDRQAMIATIAKYSTVRPSMAEMKS